MAAGMQAVRHRPVGGGKKEVKGANLSAELVLLKEPCKNPLLPFH